MRIRNIDDFVFLSGDVQKIDSVFVASGYESRSRAYAHYLSRKGLPGRVDKIAFGFSEHSQNRTRKINDKALRRLGYCSATFSGSDSSGIEDYFKQYLKQNDKKMLEMTIDISSMTRSWYAGLLRAFSESERKHPIRCIFAYFPAKWNSYSKEFTPNEILAPVPGFASLVLPNKPTALVIGVGTTSYRALGLRDYLDPQRVLSFQSEPAVDDRYVDDIYTANKDFFDTLSEKDIFRYNYFDPVSTFFKLQSACYGLVKDYRVVLASLGPKIFGLISFLIALELSEISVWRISPASQQPPVDIKATRKPILFMTLWK